MCIAVIGPVDGAVRRDLVWADRSQTCQRDPLFHNYQVTKITLEVVPETIYFVFIIKAYFGL